jgi:hypothetical protein
MLAWQIGGCAEHPKGVTGEGTVDSANADLQANQRSKALQSLWNDAGADPERLKTAREATKTILWKSSAPDVLRLKAFELLMTDASEEGRADTQKFLALRMPTESQWRVLGAYCDAIRLHAAEPGWKSLSASLVRSYARRVPSPTDPERPERAALMAIHPGEDLAGVVFDVFAHPTENGAPKFPDDSARLSREAAWDLLGRIDPDGSKRTALASGAASQDPVIQEVNTCARELGVVPITGSELNWMRALKDDKDRRNAAWWTEVSSDVAKLGAEQRRGLRLRHLEPVRWAMANRPEWTTASRDQLFNELTERLKGRHIWRNTDGVGMDGRSKETPREWANELVWGDLLAILVIDEAVHKPGVVGELFTQAAADQADTTTEYGGVLWVADQGGVVPGTVRGTRPPSVPGEFALRGYQPRTTERKDDRTFMAPEAMFKDSPRALAHYHFHVQTANNADYAGPGRGDLDYATMHGRNCIVFTSVREGLMDVDYYQSSGVVIDLGEISSVK